MKSFDVIVLGVGTMGAAACYHLARNGHTVLGLEQHDIPHRLGAHHGHSRMIRLAYYEHPDYVPLLQRAYALWRDLEIDYGKRLLHITGGLYVGPREGAFIQGARLSAERHGLGHELLDPAAMERAYPEFRVGRDLCGFYENEAGFLIPKLVMAAHVQGALVAGADLRGHETVTGWEATRSGVRVTTAEGNRFRGRHLLITAGAWTPEVLADLKLRLQVTRQTWAWFWPNQPAPFALGTFPCWFYERKTGGGFYGFPMMPDDPGFKLALHHPGKTVKPACVERHRLPDDETPLREFLKKRIPAAHGNLLAVRTCLYTNSPDGHFIVDRHPRHDRVTIACGFSGHGFKFASVMGEVLADLATRGRSEHSVEFLGLKRF